MNSDLTTLQVWPSTPLHPPSPNTYITSFTCNKYEQIKVFLPFYYQLEIERKDQGKEEKANKVWNNIIYMKISLPLVSPCLLVIVHIPAN